MFEKIIFNLFAFTLFVLVFIKLIKKNDGTYVYLLLAQFIGITINFIELILGRQFSILLKLLMYFLSVILPLIIFWLEYKKHIEFSEMYYLLMANFFIILKKDEIAKEYLMKLIEKKPNTYKGHCFLAEIYERNNKLELALEEYENVYELNRKNKDIYFKIGKISFEIGKEDDTIAIMSELVKNKPDFQEASIILADALNKKEEYKEAVQVYMLALKYNPVDYDLYYNLAMTYTLLNDFSKAKEYYTKAAELNSELYHAKYNIAKLNLLYGELEESEKYFIECINSEDVEIEAYYYLARIAMIRGEKDKAKNYANIAIEENPEIYDKMNEENIFMPIMDEVKKPKKRNRNIEKERKKNKNSEREKLIDKHLDDVCKIVGKLNNNDIRMMENLKKTSKKENKKEVKKEQGKEIIKD